MNNPNQRNDATELSFGEFRITVIFEYPKVLMGLFKGFKLTEKSDRSLGIRLSEAGRQQVDNARKRKGWNKLQVAWYLEAETAETTLKRFWAKKSIRPDNFMRLCKAVGIENWQELADFM